MSAARPRAPGVGDQGVPQHLVRRPVPIERPAPARYPAIRVQAKSSPPPVRDGSVLRRVLLDRLAASPAVLVSVAAPPGYGKTTLHGPGGRP